MPIYNAIMELHEEESFEEEQERVKKIYWQGTLVCKMSRSELLSTILYLHDTVLRQRKTIDELSGMGE